MQEEEKGIYEFDLNYLINHIPGGIAIYKLADPLKILYFNDGVCALSGHSREEYWEIVESDAIEIVLEEDRKELNNEIIAAVSENRKIDATYRIRHKDGGVVWIHLSALRIREEGGFPIYYAIFMDISEERNTQRHLSELAEREELYTKADKALLFAKNNGKNQYRFFGELMSTPSSLLLRNMEWLLDEGTNAIYICNVENYELLYMNKLARQMANTQGNTYIGKKCYKELMHLNDPCPFCKISSMKRESFCERRFKVPYSGTELLMKGKIINWNGIKAHVEFIMDISKYRMIE